MLSFLQWQGVIDRPECGTAADGQKREALCVPNEMAWRGQPVTPDRDALAAGYCKRAKGLTPCAGGRSDSSRRILFRASRARQVELATRSVILARDG